MTAFSISIFVVAVGIFIRSKLLIKSWRSDMLDSKTSIPVFYSAEWNHKLSDKPYVNVYAIFKRPKSGVFVKIPVKRFFVKDYCNDYDFTYREAQELCDELRKR